MFQYYFKLGLIDAEVERKKEKLISLKEKNNRKNEWMNNSLV